MFDNGVANSPYQHTRNKPYLISLVNAGIQGHCRNEAKAASPILICAVSNFMPTLPM